MPGSDYRLCKFGMIAFNWRYVQQWLYIQDEQVLHVRTFWIFLSNATPTIMFPWNWQIWWQHDPSSRTQGLGLQFLCHKKDCWHHAQCFGSNGTKLSKCCSNVVLLSGFLRAGIFAAQCCLLQEVLLILPDSALPMMYELCSCEQWLVGLLLVALPAFQARHSRKLWNSSCFIWCGNCWVVWPRHELHTSFTLELQGEKESCFLHFCFVRLNLMGHSESLKRPQFLRANYASVDILYCLSVIYFICVKFYFSIIFQNKSFFLLPRLKNNNLKDYK